jgi:hypothetical protein
MRAVVHSRAGEPDVLRVRAGLPLHRFRLDRTGDAHAAVEAGAVGKVLIDVRPPVADNGARS